MMRTQHQQQQDQHSRVFYELSALILSILRSPPSPISYTDQPSSVVSSSRRSSASAQITPAGFASLMLGISLALMLCGSVTFFIGFMLMPWVIGLAMVFYVAGIVSTLSVLGKSILCYVMPPPSSPRKERGSSCEERWWLGRIVQSMLGKNEQDTDVLTSGAGAASASSNVQGKRKLILHR